MKLIEKMADDYEDTLGISITMSDSRDGFIEGFIKCKAICSRIAQEELEHAKVSSLRYNPLTGNAMADYALFAAENIKIKIDNLDKL